MTTEEASAFCRALRSDAPSLPDHAQIFAPFIGSWDLVVRWYGEAGRVTRTEAGEWHFAWVLEGRGIQDVWIVPPRARRARGRLYEYGTSIRFYDPALEAWQSTWSAPCMASCAPSPHENWAAWWFWKRRRAPRRP